MNHLDALELRLSNERQYLATAKSDSERKLRRVWVSQIEKEIEKESKFSDPLPDMTDEELLNELSDNIWRKQMSVYKEAATMLREMSTEKSRDGEPCFMDNEVEDAELVAKKIEDAGRDQENAVQIIKDFLSCDLDQDGSYEDWPQLQECVYRAKMFVGNK